MSIRDDFFTALNKGAKWDVGVSIARTNPLPLDANSVFKTYADLETYCAGVLSYVGQPVAVVGETETVLYVLDQNKVPQPVGKATEGDEKTIDLSDEGVLGLHDYGKIYYRYIAAVGEEGQENFVAAHYEKTIVDADHPWKAGLIPQVVAETIEGTTTYVIGWYEPNPTTIEGINNQVSALQNTVTSLSTASGNHSERLTTAESDIDDLQAKLNGISGIFNLVASVSADDFANMTASNYDVGDVILVDGEKEYVCVEGASGKRWEVLGDPSGVTALAGIIGKEATGVPGSEDYKAATGLIGDIRNAENSITSLQSSVGTINTNISNLQTKDGELEAAIALKAAQADLTSAINRIGTNETDIVNLKAADTSINTALDTKASITYVDGKVSAINESIATKADKSVVDGLVLNSATKAELETELAKKVDVEAYNAKMTSLETADNNNSQAIANVKITADQAAVDIVTINTELAKKASASDLNNLTTRVGAAETTISGHTSSINTLTGSVSALDSGKADKTTVNNLTDRVTANEKAITDHAIEYNALEGRVTKAEGDITKAQGDATQAIANAASANTAASNAQNSADEAMAKAVAVLGTANDEAGAATVYGANKAAAAADTKATTAQDEVDALETVVGNLKTSLETADTALSERIADIEEVIGGVQGAMHFVGISSTDPFEDGVTIVNKPDYVPADGDVVIFKDDSNNTVEYIYSTGAWVELGDVSAEAQRIGALEAYNTNTVAPVVAKIPTIEGDITSNTTAIEALTARVKVNEDYRSTNDSALATLTARVKANEDAIAKEIEDRVKAIADEASARSTAITNEATARANADTILQNQIDTIVANLTWTKIGE